MAITEEERNRLKRPSLSLLMPSVRLGYWAPQEQHAPKELLELALTAESVGFDRCITSDHFHPWFHEGASSGSTQMWLSTALARTSQMRFATGVTAPIYRYHPAMLAQAFATLDHLYPGRIGLGLGTGEAMNEVPLGATWPSFKERVERLQETLTILRKLWSEDFVSFSGTHFRLRDANLYVQPADSIPIYLAASGPTVAGLAGREADGLLTVPQPDRRLEDTILPAFRGGVQASGRRLEDLDLLLEFKFSFHEDYDRALASIRRWGSTEIPGIFGKEIFDPRRLEELAMTVEPEDLLKTWHVVTDLEELVKPLEDYAEQGFTEVYLHSSSPDEESVLRQLGDRLLPLFNPS